MKLSLSAEERVLWEGQPALAVLGVWLFTKALTFAFVASFVFVWALAFFGAMWMSATRSHPDFDPFAQIGLGLVVVAPLLLGAGLVYAALLRRTYRYFVTNQRVVFTGGLLLRRRRSVHYHKITDIEASQSHRRAVVRDPDAQGAHGRDQRLHWLAVEGAGRDHVSRFGGVGHRRTSHQ